MLLLSVVSCSSEDRGQRDRLPEEKMVSTLADIHQFEALLKEGRMRDDSLAIFVKTNYEEIFNSQGIKEEQFQSTFEYYEQRPGKMDELMTKVIEELSRREAEVSGNRN